MSLFLRNMHAVTSQTVVWYKLPRSTRIVFRYRLNINSDACWEGNNVGWPSGIVFATKPERLLGNSLPTSLVVSLAFLRCMGCHCGPKLHSSRIVPLQCADLGSPARFGCCFAER